MERIPNATCDCSIVGSANVRRYVSDSRLPYDGLPVRRVVGATDWKSVVRIVIFFLVGTPTLSSTTIAQQAPIVPATIESVEGSSAEPDDDLQRLPTDRRAVQQLQELREAIRDKDVNRFHELVIALRLTEPEFMVHTEHDEFVPLHRGLADVLRDLPEKFEAIVHEDDRAASRALAKLMQSGSLDQLPAMLHRYAGTTAADTAHRLLAARHLERGESLAAKFWMTVVQQKSSSSSAMTLVPSRPPIPSRQSSVDVALQLKWTRTLPTSGHGRHASQPLIDHAVAERFIPWNAREPASDDQRVFVRAGSAIQAIETATGQPAWTRTIFGTSPAAADVVIPDERSAEPTRAIAEAMSRHRNEIAGRLAIDATRLYAVISPTDFGHSDSGATEMPFRNLIRRPAANPIGMQELVAFEKSSGRRLWAIGGRPLEARYRNELSMSWFCGVPTVDGNELLIVIERDGAQQLASVQADSGRLNWKTTLALPELTIAQDLNRQQLASQILSRGGLIFVTTTAGWCCAVDRMTHGVIWTRRLPPPTTSGTPAQNARHSGFLAQPVLPMNAVWRAEQPLLFGDTLSFISSQSDQLLAVRPTTGRLVGQTSANGSRLLLHADEQRLVVTSATHITALDSQSLEEIWSQPLHESDPRVNPPVPTGRAALQGSQLLVPLSDGSVLPVDLMSGRIGSEITGVHVSCGSSLRAFGDDILCAAADTITICGPPNSEHDATPAEPLARIRLLVASQDFATASDLLQRVPRTALNAHELHQLAVVAAFGQYLSTTDQRVQMLTRLDELTAAPQATNSQRAAFEACRLDLIATDSQVAHQNPDQSVIPAHAEIQTAALDSRVRGNDEPPKAKVDASQATRLRQLVAALRLDAGVLKIQLPDRDRLMEWLSASSRTTAEEHSGDLRRSLKCRLLEEIRVELSRAATVENAVTSGLVVESLDDLDLLQIQHPLVVAESLRRVDGQIGQENVSEQTIQMLLMCGLTDVAANSPPELSSQLHDRWSRIAELARDERQNLCARRLLSVLTDEASSNPGTKASSAADDFDVPNRTTNSAVRVIPVSTVSQMPLRQMTDQLLPAAHRDDAFFAQTAWSAQREIGRLKAFDRGMMGSSRAVPIWNLGLPGSEPRFVTGGDRMDRRGSICWLWTSDRVSAFSVIEQRWLWQRRFPVAPERARQPARRGEMFTDFHAGAASKLGLETRLAGATDRHLVLSHSSQVECVDLLTGETLWSAARQNPDLPLVACEHVVLMPNHTGASWDVRDLLTGSLIVPQRLPIELPSDAIGFVDTVAPLPQRVIGAAGRDVVAWLPRKTDARGPALQWIDPLTLNVSRTVNLDDVQSATFTDQRTLVGLRNDERLQTVDLRTGMSRLSSRGFEPRSPSEAATRAEVVLRDGELDLILHRADGGQPMALSSPMLFGLDSQPVQGRLSAFSHDDQTCRWSIAVPDRCGVCVTENSGPFLLLLQSAPSPGPTGLLNAGGLLPIAQSGTIIGLWRESGEIAFRHPVVTRAPLPTLRVIPSRDPNAWDLDAFGNRARIVVDLETAAAELPAERR